MNNSKFKSRISSMGKKIKRKIVHVPAAIMEYFNVGDEVEITKVKKNKSQ